MVNYKKNTFKKLSWRRRNTTTTISCLDRIAIKNMYLKATYLKKLLSDLTIIYSSTGTFHTMIYEVCRQLQEIKGEYVSTLCTDVDYMSVPLPKVVRKHLTIADLPQDVITMFRFRSKSDLYEVFTGLQFPIKMKAPSRHTYGGEEVFLLGLLKLSFPTTTGSMLFEQVFGLYYQRVSECFHLFLEHMLHNWLYLITDNNEYWLDKFPMFSEAIRHKLAEKGCFMDEAEFCCFGFIDNTMNATCRVGAGPMTDGLDAPRKDPLIQRAFYNGWKKLHGTKYQTIDLPNGMPFFWTQEH